MIEGVCCDKIVCVVVILFFSVIGYLIFVKVSLIFVRVLSSCSCIDYLERGFKRRYLFLIEMEIECNLVKYILVYFIYVFEMFDLEDFFCNFVEIDIEI